MATDEILEALRQIAREKSVDLKMLVETVRLGILTAAKKRYATAADVQVAFDEGNGKIRVLVHKKVVPVAIDLEGEIDFDEALVVAPGIRVNETVPVEVPVAEFGRNAIQAAKQVLVQKVREAERGNVAAEYTGRKGTILSGSVSQVDRGSVIVKIGRTEGIIPPKELIFRDRFRIGDPVRALLKIVDETQKGPMLILSRTDPEFVRRLFENEVPEIFERVVEIRDIAREAGSRTKITVISHDDRVDPVGACVGMKGSRVQAIVRELGGERIDIVPFSPDQKILISRALSPARVLDVALRETESEKFAVVIVSDDQLMLAVGRRGGQNVRLAQKLTGWNIELKTNTQVDLEQGGGSVPDIELEELTKELGPKMVEKLIKAGKETLQDVLRSSAEELTQIPGIAEKTATRLLGLARQILEERASGHSPSSRADETAGTMDEEAEGEAGSDERRDEASGESDDGPGDAPEEAPGSSTKGAPLDDVTAGSGEESLGEGDPHLTDADPDSGLIESDVDETAGVALDDAPDVTPEKNREGSA
jgi:transcription termination/antitermination protein NusA